MRWLELRYDFDSTRFQAAQRRGVQPPRYDLSTSLDVSLANDVIL